MRGTLLALFLILAFYSGCISNQSCDDSNPCTKDESGIAGFSCAHTPLDGNLPGCEAVVPPCRQQTCVSGSCGFINLSSCCGNGLCESNEDISNCAADCAASIDLECNASGPLVPILLKMEDSLDTEFVHCTITNNGETRRDLVLSAEIPGWTNPYSTSFALFPNESKTVFVKFDWKDLLYKNKESADASIAFSVQSSGVAVASETVPVSLSPKEDIFWMVQIDNENVSLQRSIVAWITPHEKCIQSLLSTAKELAPKRALGGYAGYGNASEQDKTNRTMAQAKALFYAIKGQGISYVNTPVSFSGSQRVKMPADSLVEKSGNCVDGSVLFASAFEALGMNPVLVAIPNHMFVGVETYPESGRYNFIETTMVGSSSFEEAVIEGSDEFSRYESTPDISVTDVKKDRAAVTPFPSFTDCVLNATCPDGTPAGHCSQTKPRLCTGSGFIDAATVCGCGEGFAETGDSCVSTMIKNETFVLGHIAYNRYFFWSPSYTNEEYITLRYIISSDVPLDIRVFPTKSDYELFAGGSSYTHYPGYMAENTLHYEQTVVQTTVGGIGLENVGDSDALVNLIVMRAG